MQIKSHASTSLPLVSPLFFILDRIAPRTVRPPSPGSASLIVLKVSTLKPLAMAPTASSPPSCSGRRSATTATSTVEAEPLKFLKPEDKKVMNRNSLFEVSKKLIENNKDFKPPKENTYNLSGKPLKEKMIKVLDKLYNEKVILDHGLEVGKELANVLSGGDTSIDKTLTEDDMYKLELDSFMRLIQTKKTQDRIKHTLSTGKPLIN